MWYNIIDTIEAVGGLLLKENGAQECVNPYSMETLREVFGNFDENIQIIEGELGVRIIQRDEEIAIYGQPIQAAAARETIEKLIERIEAGEKIDRGAIRYTLGVVCEGQGHMLADMSKDVIAITSRGKQVKAKTIGQKKYMAALERDTVTFCIGPAGSGKTYLAIAKAVVALKKKEVSRIILTRPAVEAGERLGFLPGDLQQKVDPYLRPLYDALHDFLGPEAFLRFMEKGVIEVAPLAYMRGRTIGEAYIILDEAQNCTREQMKMFLTRFGEGSKVIVTGDITQVDLPNDKTSGLMHVEKVLKNVDGLSFVYLTDKDVVRHEIVQNIVRAYEKYEKRHVRNEVK